MKRPSIIKLMAVLLGFSVIATVTSTIAWFAPTAVIENNKTLKPVKAITWEGGDDAVITDAQRFTVKIKC